MLLYKYIRMINPLTVISVFTTLMFFISGIDKLFNLTRVTKGLINRVNLDLPYAIFFLAIIIATLLEIIAPLVIVYSAETGEWRDYAIQSAQALTVFTILVTLVYHWPVVGNKYYPFISNITTIGGLMSISYIFSHY